jgi:hypothetical protein
LTRRIGTLRTKVRHHAKSEKCDKRTYIQEARGTLFNECCDALACIIGGDDASESGFLNRQPIIDRRIHAAMDGR